MTEPLAQDDEQVGDDAGHSTSRSTPPTSGEENTPLYGLRGVRHPVVFPARDRVAWLLSSIAFLILLSFFLPYTVERMTYSYHHGRQRALYDAAGDKLENVSLRDMSEACQLVANRVGPSVVHINATSAAAGAGKAIAGHAQWQHPTMSQGSGVVVDNEGYIVTNAHVVRGYGDIRVKLSDGRTVDADVVGIDPMTDVAVLKVNADRLLPAEWGDSNQLAVGGLVWALGSPLGLQHSVTFGILSGKDRSFQSPEESGVLDSQGIASDSPYHNFLQTDAAVNPGNSGGPLVDSEGRIVGINAAIVGKAYQGISFAIPSSIAQPIYKRIRDEGRVTRSWLGVAPKDITPELAEELGVPDASGALVTKVVSNLDGAVSPAQKAGLKAGDVIVRWGGEPVGNSTKLFSLVALTSVGSTVKVVVLRDGREVTLSVTVTERPPGS
ncbi:MAG: S1C family serine protease [Planctomycetota bacterium]